MFFLLKLIENTHSGNQNEKFIKKYKILMNYKSIS